MATYNPYITPKLFRFFRDLKKNNNRDWFQANKQRYEDDVQGPLLAFIDDFTGPLYKISPHYRAEAKKVAEDCGGRVSSSVSAKTDFLVQGGKPGSKAKKAEALGVEVLLEDDFLGRVTS